MGTLLEEKEFMSPVMANGESPLSRTLTVCIGFHSVNNGGFREAKFQRQLYGDELEEG